MAIWLNARKIPYKGFKLKTERTLVLDPKSATPEKVKLFLAELERQVKAKYYAVGFLAYEFGYLLERRLTPYYQIPNCPLAYFHLGRHIEVLEIYPEELAEASGLSFHLSELSLSIDRNDYLSTIERIKDYIARGHTYQVNFTCKLRFCISGSAYSLFRALLFSQRCEYACYLEGEDFVLLSLSPELFLQKQGKMLKSSPMKGTKKRAPTLVLDQKLKTRLRRDVKSQAENLMILDLLRNDFGRISEVGSVKVDEYLKVKTYPTLHQMVSTVSGSLEKEDLYSLFSSLFPCGSVTGAPKIRTMEIIRELETEPRGVYTGAVGYFKPKGDFLFNVAIRTAFLQKTQEGYSGELGIGSGIVWDSQPEEEFEETLLKARFLTNIVPYFYLIETFTLPIDEETLRLHFQRLKGSTKYFGFNFKFKTPSELFSQVKSRINRGDERVRVRLALYPNGRLEVKVFSFEPWPEKLKVAFKLRQRKPSVFHFHKTSLRSEYEEARRFAAEQGFAEVIFYNEEGEIIEGSISNFFAKKGKTLFTPPLELGLLPGVLRRKLLKSGRAKEKRVKISDLSNFDALYVGNSSRGLGKITHWVIL